MTRKAHTAMSTPKPRGRKPAHPGGRRSKFTVTTLNTPEREAHEKWLRTKGWPEVPETTIVRQVLEEAWQQAGVAPPDLLPNAA